MHWKLQWLKSMALIGWALVAATAILPFLPVLLFQSPSFPLAVSPLYQLDPQCTNSTEAGWFRLKFAEQCLPTEVSGGCVMYDPKLAVYLGIALIFGLGVCLLYWTYLAKFEFLPANRRTRCWFVSVLMYGLVWSGFLWGVTEIGFSRTPVWDWCTPSSISTTTTWVSRQQSLLSGSTQDLEFIKRLLPSCAGLSDVEPVLNFINQSAIWVHLAPTEPLRSYVLSLFEVERAAWKVLFPLQGLFVFLNVLFCWRFLRMNCTRPYTPPDPEQPPSPTSIHRV